MKGKTLNTYSATYDKVAANKELGLLRNTLGLGKGVEGGVQSTLKSALEALSLSDTTDVDSEVQQWMDHPIDAAESSDFITISADIITHLFKRLDNERI